MDDTPTRGVLPGRGFARPCGWLRFAARARAAAAVRGRIVSGGGLDGEKTWAVPDRAGDGPRDRRQAGIGGALPDIAVRTDRHGVAATLIIAHQHRSDLEIALTATPAATARKAVQQFEGDAVERAECLLLDPVGDHPPQQVEAEALGRRASKFGLPAPPQASRR
jgi:hypothetical protein